MPQPTSTLFPYTTLFRSGFFLFVRQLLGQFHQREGWPNLDVTDIGDVDVAFVRDGANNVARANTVFMSNSDPVSRLAFLVRTLRTASPLAFARLLFL